MNRTTNRVQDYERRRAVALDGMQHKHDAVIEATFKARHAQVATGPKALLVRQVLTAFAQRDADNGGRIITVSE